MKYTYTFTFKPFPPNCSLSGKFVDPLMILRMSSQLSSQADSPRWRRGPARRGGHLVRELNTMSALHSFSFLLSIGLLLH